MLINFFPPAAGGGVYRPLSFVKYLSGLSWDVTVVTPRPGEFWIADEGLEKEIPPDVRVVRTPSLSGQRILGRVKGRKNERGSSRSSSGFGLMRKIGEMFLLPDTYAGWIPFARSAASALCEKEDFDLVYSTSPPDSTHLAAMAVSRRFALPWVVDFRDPWISLYLRDPPTPFHAMLHRRMEKRSARADLVLVTTDWQKEKLEELYPGCHVEKVRNGFDEDDFSGLSNLSGPSGPFTVLHCGMLTLGRSSRPFLDGLSIFVKSRPEIAGDFRVVFLGARESENEDWVSRLGLEDVVEFRDNISHDECVRLERSSHLLLLLKHDDERYRGLVPGKLFEYLGARRPVLALAPEGEAASIITETGRGEVVGFGDPQKVASVLGRFYDLDRRGRLDLSYSLGELPGFSRRVAAEKLDRLLRTLLEEKERRDHEPH